MTGPRKKSQARRIIDKLGGAGPGAERRLAKAIGLAPSTVYRWDYPFDRGGCGGVVPTRSWPALTSLARREGIFLTDEDLDPRPR